MTIACATGSGLEVQMTNNEFRSMPSGLEELLIMPGEIIWLLSGGQIRPLYHRVRLHHQNPKRMALLFFGDIDPCCCDPWISNEINRQVDIGTRVLASVNRFGLKGFAME